MQFYFFDGAMGTMLQAGGLEEGQCPEVMNVESPEIVKNIHKAYLEAGSNLITTNTFGANGIKLRDYDFSHRVEELNTAAVRVARAAIEETGIHAEIAGDIGPTGVFIAPLGDVTFDEVYDCFKEQAVALLKAGVDYIIIETIIDIQEMRAALLASKDAIAELGLEGKAKVIAQLSYGEDGRTITGTSPREAVILLDAMGADVIGANCSLGPEQLLPILKEMALYTNKPLVIQANAGMPILVGTETVFPLSAEEMASYAPALVEAGATYLGACCGSTPEHIRAMVEIVTQMPEIQAREEVKPFTALTSRTKTVFIGHGYEPAIIGERINPTGRKVLAEELRQGKFLRVKEDALAQEEAGASILDVNMGVPDADEAQLMAEAIKAISMLVETPLSIDSLKPEALEEGLKNYPGRPLINSCNAEPEQMERIIPLAKRYGAALLCLPLGKGDLPKTAEERLELAQVIVDEAFRVGLRPQDLLLDPLVLTLASGTDSAAQTLRTLKLYKQEFGFPTVCGLSNISFGLPQRPYVNGQFLTMALANGLTTPILNPLEPSVKKAFTMAKTLLGFDEGAREFIEYIQNEPEVGVVANAAPKASKVAVEDVVLAEGVLGTIQVAVMKGEKEKVSALVEEALKDGVDPLAITKEALSLAMKELGKQFATGKAFLPQVMLAAEAMHIAFETIKKVLPQQAGVTKETIIVATVKGDIHDLGKNIVAALLSNNGYRVIDLGKDVSAETVVEAIREYNPSIVGLASLMTTTLPQVNVTIQAIRDAGCDVKVMVGGAVVTPEYAEAAGADKYVRDGIQAVDIVDALLAE